MAEPLELSDLMVAAEFITSVDADRLLRMTRVGLAESALAAPHATYAGVDFYPDDRDKAGILCSRIVKNHPIPDGNKRLGLMLMLEFLARNRMVFTMPGGGNDEIADHIERLAAGTLPEPDFVAWVRELVRPAPP